VHEVIVVGAGIAGLTAAWRLRQASRDVCLLEAQREPGGHIRTLAVDDFRLETGPSSFLGSSEYLWRLIRELGMENDAEPAAPASRHRFILRNGRLHPLPLGVWSFVRTPLLSTRAKLRLAMEPWISGGAQNHDAAWDFFKRRFGEEAATYIMSPFVSGVYAGDVRILGARSAFALFWNFEKQTGSMVRGAFRHIRSKKKRLAKEGLVRRKGLFSFRGGLGRLTGSLAARLGPAAACGVHVDRIRHSPAGGILVSAGERSWESRLAVLAVPPPIAAGLLRDTAPEAGKRLQSIPMAPVTLAHWAVPFDGGQPLGFGFLVPRVCGPRILGTIFVSQLFARRAPEGQQLYASFYGGMTDPEAMDMDDEALAALIQQEHALIFGSPVPRPRMLKILRYPHAIPQLLPGHTDEMEAVRKGLEVVPGLILAGNYLTGVGMEHATESGFRAAEQAESRLKAMAGGHS
jgi:oxygen-dependent protoporphyrinogen oxidase